MILITKAPGKELNKIMALFAESDIAFEITNQRNGYLKIITGEDDAKEPIAVNYVDIIVSLENKCSVMKAMYDRLEAYYSQNQTLNYTLVISMLNLATECGKLVAVRFYDGKLTVQDEFGKELVIHEVSSEFGQWYVSAKDPESIEEKEYTIPLFNTPEAIILGVMKNITRYF